MTLLSCFWTSGHLYLSYDGEINSPRRRSQLAAKGSYQSKHRQSHWAKTHFSVFSPDWFRLLLSMCYWCKRNLQSLMASDKYVTHTYRHLSQGHSSVNHVQPLFSYGSISPLIVRMSASCFTFWFIREIQNYIMGHYIKTGKQRQNAKLLYRRRTKQKKEEESRKK